MEPLPVFWPCTVSPKLPWWLILFFSGKESACNARYVGLIPVLESSPGEGNGNPLQYSCLGKFHGQRSPEGLLSLGSQKSQTQLLTKQQQ